MYDHTVWISSSWLWAVAAVWVVLTAGISMWIDDKMNGDQNYGPSDSFFAGLPCMFIGAILASVLVVGAFWIQSLIGPEIGFVG